MMEIDAVLAEGSFRTKYPGGGVRFSGAPHKSAPVGFPKPKGPDLSMRGARASEMGRAFAVDLISAAAEPATDSLGAVVRASAIGIWCLDRKDLASASA
jgi:hypothetical protein